MRKYCNISFLFGGCIRSGSTGPRFPSQGRQLRSCRGGCRIAGGLTRERFQLVRTGGPDSVMSYSVLRSQKISTQFTIRGKLIQPDCIGSDRLWARFISNGVLIVLHSRKSNLVPDMRKLEDPAQPLSLFIHFLKWHEAM